MLNKKPYIIFSNFSTLAPYSGSGIDFHKNMWHI